MSDEAIAKLAAGTNKGAVIDSAEKQN